MLQSAYLCILFFDFSNKFVPETVSHMNFFKRYLFKKALLEDELANEERRRKEVVIEKQPEPVIVVEPQTVVEAKEETPILQPEIGGELSSLIIISNQKFYHVLF